MLEEQQHFEEDFDDNNETEDVEFDFDKELDIPSDEEWYKPLILIFKTLWL